MVLFQIDYLKEPISKVFEEALREHAWHPGTKQRVALKWPDEGRLFNSLTINWPKVFLWSFKVLEFLF